MKTMPADASKEETYTRKKVDQDMLISIKGRKNKSKRATNTDLADSKHKACSFSRAFFLEIAKAVAKTTEPNT